MIFRIGISIFRIGISNLDIPILVGDGTHQLQAPFVGRAEQTHPQNRGCVCLLCPYMRRRKGQIVRNGFAGGINPIRRTAAIIEKL